MSFSLARRLVLLGLLAGLPAVQAQPTYRVRDINTTHPPLQRWDWSDEMEAAGGKVFFVRDDGVHGKELWVSDGSAGGPHLVRDILPGARSSNPTSLTAVGSALYFIADDGIHGRELWRSDGTEAGTVLALDFNPFLRDSVLSVSAAGDPWMLAVVDFENVGLQLVFTDGTPSGTGTMGPLHPGPFEPPARVLSYSSQQVLYAFNDGVHGVEPWVWSKGTSQRTMLGDLHPGTGSSVEITLLPDGLQGADAVAAPWGGFLFLANDGPHGSELWSTDGTAAGTHLVKDINPGAADSSPFGLTVLNGAVYFHASGPEGNELWRTDGTAAGTTLVKDINPGSDGSNPIEMTRVGNQLFFLAFNPTAGTPLWRSDGTAAGTVPLHGSEPINFCCSAPGYIRYGFSDVAGQLMFLAGTNLWRSDGTDAGTVRVADIGSAAAIPMRDGYAAAGGGFYLRGGPQGEEVWRSDGTAAGTARILSGPALTSSFFLDDGTAA
ncbi:MAG TPA: ELWxxDGT repeat protein, partial [Thermoanaerobaculia bacterium]